MNSLRKPGHTLDGRAVSRRMQNMDSQDHLSEDCFTKVSFIALAARKARVNARLLDPKWSVILGRGFRVRGGPATAVIGFLSTPSGF